MAGNRVTVGNVEITSLSDGILEFDLCNFFPNHKSDEEWQGYRQHLVDGHKVRFNLASYLIRSQGRTILVDTGMGARPADAPDTPWGELMNDFQAHGLRADEIDMVVMTHLHRDHVGWNLVPPAAEGGRYTPTFPNARYWFSAKDWEACHNPDVMPTRFPNAPTTVWPLEDLGLIEFMEGEHVLTSELTAFPTPGHTPGHMSIMVSSQGERAIILGDAIPQPGPGQRTRLGIPGRHGPGADPHHPPQADGPVGNRGHPGHHRPLPLPRIRQGGARRGPPLLAGSLTQQNMDVPNAQDQVTPASNFILFIL